MSFLYINNIIINLTHAGARLQYSIVCVARGSVDCGRCLRAWFAQYIHGPQYVSSYVGGM